jgi:radical SAM superfamily enzyme YgiQ (UPF0313 family)
MGPGEMGKKRALAIARELINRKVNIDYLIDARVDGVDEHVLKILKVSGLKRIFLGIESGSQRVLDFLNKKTTVEMNKRALEIINRLEIDVLIGFINFDPFTTIADVKKNIKFYRETGLINNTAALSRFFTHLNVFQGTPLAEKLGRLQVLKNGDGKKFSLDLGYRYVDKKAEILARRAGAVGNQAGKSYVLSTQYRQYYDTIKQRISRITGMNDSSVETEMISYGLIKPETFGVWHRESLSSAFHIFSELIDYVDKIELENNEDKLAGELQSIMDKHQAVIDVKFFNKPFHAVMEEIRTFQKNKMIKK